MLFHPARLFDHLRHVPHGQENAQQQQEHQRRHEDQQDGLQGFRQLAGLVLNLFLLQHGQLLNHGFDVAGFFTDRDHLQFDG